MRRLRQEIRKAVTAFLHERENAGDHDPLSQGASGDQEAEHLQLNYSLVGFLHIDANAVPRKYLRYTAFLATAMQAEATIRDGVEQPAASAELYALFASTLRMLHGNCIALAWQLQDPGSSKSSLWAFL